MKRLAVINLELNQKNNEMKGAIRNLVGQIRQRESKYKADNFQRLDPYFMVDDDAKQLVQEIAEETAEQRMWAEARYQPEFVNKILATMQMDPKRSQMLPEHFSR